MAPHRKVVADSDDDDDDNDGERGEVVRPGADAEIETEAESMSLVDNCKENQREVSEDGHYQQAPLLPPVSTPQAEPLSPDHQPPLHHSGQSSGSTSQSAFARIAAAQQEKVLRQSRLIENIVRQSQRVVVDSGSGSRSGGDGSGSSGRWLDGEDGGSGVSGQGRVVLDLVGLAAEEGGAGAGQPTRARGSEWDIPSSPETPADGLLTTSRGRRSSPAARYPADAISTEELWDQPALPPAKRQRVSMHNTLGDSSSSGKGSGFCVVPSNLTTMQKLEYQRVSVPQQNSNSNSLAGENTAAVRTTPTGQQQKSSCATTIAYTTPSRYASSGGRYPWESSVIIAEDGADQEVIQIPSSLDIIAREPPSSVPAQEPDLPETEADTTRELESPGAEELPTTESPVRQGVRSSARKRQPTKKILDEELSAPESPIRQGIRSSARKRKPAKKIIDEEEDELAAHTDPWAFDAVDDHEEAYKPRPGRRRTKASSPSRDRTNRRISKANDEHEEDELALPDIEEPRSARGRKRRVEASDEEEEPEEVAVVPKKKRGRPKKKQPVEETAPEEGFINDECDTQNQKREPVTQPSEAAIKSAPEPPPKKRRGRPKKSDKAKATTTAAPDTVETPKAAKASKKDEGRIEDTDRKHVAEIPPSDDDDDEAPSPSPKRPALELKDSNTAVPTEKTKEQDMEASDLKPAKPVVRAVTPTALQRGAQYRVGLSKKSRIAPLLKIIRK